MGSQLPQHMQDMDDRERWNRVSRLERAEGSDARQARGLCESPTASAESLPTAACNRGTNNQLCVGPTAPSEEGGPGVHHGAVVAGGVRGAATAAPKLCSRMDTSPPLPRMGSSTFSLASQPRPNSCKVPCVRPLGTWSPGISSPGSPLGTSPIGSHSACMRHTSGWVVCCPAKVHEHLLRMWTFICKLLPELFFGEQGNSR